MQIGCRCFACHPLFPIVFSDYEIAKLSGIVADAAKERVTIKPTDEVYLVEGIRAVACIRVIKRSLARMCGCWVAPEHRGRGIGEALVKYRIDHIINHRSCKCIDTYAFNSRLYRSLGFEERSSYQIGTKLLRKVIQR